MRIAQVAPLFESVPPRLYGGTERIVYHLTESLTNLGHEVTLFASGDSMTSARLIATGTEGLRLGSCKEPLAPHFVQFERLRVLSQEFDIIHLHTEVMSLPILQSLRTPTILTLHGRLDLPEYQELFALYDHVPLVSISLNQRLPLPFARWIGNVYHGLDQRMFHPKYEQGKYLAFLGRLSPEKGFEKAVEVARRTGYKLKVSAKIESINLDYYSSIKHLFTEPFVEFIGEISDHEKSDFLGNAIALLFPIQWPEPFGLVMIEALAAGTPVIAFKYGSVPEIIAGGKTGFIVNNVEDAAHAVEKIDLIKRENCRKEFECRFSRKRMALDYIRIYQKLLSLEESNKVDSLHQPLSPDRLLTSEALGATVERHSSN